MTNPKTSTEDTMKLLRLISSHLSSRVDCKKVEYCVTITDHVTMSPLIEVYPDRRTRGKFKKENLIYHIQNYHVDVSQLQLVKGTYIYQLSVTKKSRRWARSR